MEKKINIKTLFIISGAYISYMIGAGFASGNEVFQFFGSWGFPGAFFAILGSAAATVITCFCAYKAGQSGVLEKSSDVYTYFCGKYFGKIVKGLVFVDIFASFMLMFSGAGTLLNQVWNIPQWVGALVLGVASGVVVLGGLKTVENVLGSAGILILVYLLIFGVFALFYPKADISQASGLYQAVKNGVVYQANLFALPPFSWIPGLADINSAITTGILYAGLNTMSGLAFCLTLGKRTKDNLESMAASIATTIAFYACVVLVLLLMLLNFDSLINPNTGEMFAFPVLAAIESMWPAGGWTYVIIIFTGIFTTTAGFLWVLCDWLFSGEVRTKKANGFIAGMLIVGLTLGGVIPFSKLINIFFPIFGFVGVIIIVFLVVRMAKGYGKAEEKDAAVETY